MEEALTILGYGEAGRTFANAAGWKKTAHVFDVVLKVDEYQEDGVQGHETLDSAVASSPRILSLVTAGQATIAAQGASDHLILGALFFDMNSVAPETKRTAAKMVEAAGGRYVDVAIMAPVNPAQMDVPLLLSGLHAEAGKATLEQLGFLNCRVVGDEVGSASMIKMLRSVIYKGMEALTAECLLACEKAGVTDEVLGCFDDDWSARADYRLDRMLVHGQRRSAEMTEAAKTLSSLGIEPLLTRGTVERQATLGALGLNPPPEGLTAKLEAISQ